MTTSTAVRQWSPPAATGFRIDYGPAIEAVLTALAGEISRTPALVARYEPRWLAIQLLEHDKALWMVVQAVPGGAAVCAVAAAAAAQLEAELGDESDILLADRRYSWINQLAADVMLRPVDPHTTLSDRIDSVVTNRVLGLPIFLAAMWIVFKLTTDVAAPMVDWIAAVIEGPVTNWMVVLFGAVGLGGSWLEGLVVDGVIAGVGGVLVFVPVLAMLYLALALLEDSGYMARVAFVMDRFMRPFGLHGKSFLPMIVGFGCTVPAIYATRTLERRRDRVLTGLLVPFMSCSARLPVYVLFAAVFFPASAGTAVFLIYLLGIVVAIALGLFLQRALPASDEDSLFIMELPPYRLPTLRSIELQAWQRIRAFVRKAWTVILAMSVLVWALMAVQIDLPNGRIGPAEVEESLFAGLANAAAPLFAPLGFGSWEATGSLLTGIVAKEVVVSSLAQTYGVGAGDSTASNAPVNIVADLAEIGQGFVSAVGAMLRAIPAIFGLGGDVNAAEAAPSALMSAIYLGFEQSSDGHAALAGLAFMVFVLLYTPCMVAVAASRHEFGAGWMWASVIGQFALAWLTALVVFQGGLLLGF